MNGFSTARLVERHGSTTEAEHMLPERTVTIGRESFNDIVINDPEISRRHARIIYENGRYTFEDLGSTNGSFINGQRITSPVLLRQGDNISLGETITLTFYADDDAGATMIEDAPTMIETGPASGPVNTPVEPQYGAGYNYAQPSANVPPAHQAATPTPPPPPPESLPPPPQRPASPANKRSPTRLILGCGCLLFLLIFACAATLFILDTYAQDFLYCTLLQPLFEVADIALSCP